MEGTIIIKLNDNKIKNIEDELIDLGFQIVDSNFEKPWGAYFCIDEKQAQHFSDKFFVIR